MINSISSVKKRIFISGMVGNLLEIYDLTICFFFAKTLSETFFPTSTNNLLNIFYVFLVGFLSKPIGSLIISLYSDQNGRKKMLLISIILTGISTALIGFIPSYKTVGSLSLIIFLILRILQNIFVGGEYTNSIVYLIENGGENHQGYYGSWAAIGVNLGVLIASCITLIISLSIHYSLLPEWGWRLAFFPAIIAMLVGIWMRTSTPESLSFMLENANTPINNKLKILTNSLKFIRQYPYKCMSISAITWLGVCITYSVYVYGPIHMATVNKLSTYEAFSINSISLLILVFFIPIFGILSDSINKISLLMSACVLFSFLAIPYFWYMSYGNYIQILFIHSLISLPAACFFSIAPVLIAQTFPTKIRCTAVSLIYQTISSIAAGVTPIILLKIIYISHIPYAPGYLIIFSAIIGYFCLFILKKNEYEETFTEISKT